jgi:UDP-N-acetylmuramate--alanine ligase
MYKKREHLHFMGIGGIGMSGIAQILRLQGYIVTGCDESKYGKTIDHLSEIGCTISQGHDIEHVHDADVLVYSSAIKKDNPEIVAAVAKGIPVIPRAIMLAELMRTKYSIAVSGAHGKTTTTSLISHILIEAEKNPTVIIGGILKNIATHAHLGDSNILIAEADESDRSLLYLNPSMAVVTNIDAEHLDVYKDIEDIKQTFRDFLARLPFYGKAFLCSDDPNIRAILPLHHISVTKYGIQDDADIQGVIVQLNKAQSIFDVYNHTLMPGSTLKKRELLGRVVLNIPGIHNIQNALAAIALTREFDVPFATIAQALSNFKGVERRFELKGVFNGAEIFDDYGHHPTEIRHTFMVAQRRKSRNLHVVFQPHRFSRTAKLWDDFVNIFADQQAPYTLNKIYITDIYAASEAPINGISSERLVAAIKKLHPDLDIHYVDSYDKIASLVEQDLHDGDLLLTIGAGKVNQVGERLLSKEPKPI